MTTLTPPAYSKIATPEAEVATLGDLLDWSSVLRVPACMLYRVMQEHSGVHPERGCDCFDGRDFHVPVSIDVAVQAPARYA